MTTKRRRRFTADFKKRVALEALRGDRTVQAIAAKHEVHPNQVGTWKRQAIEGLDEVFARGGSPGPSEHEATIRDLHAKKGVAAGRRRVRRLLRLMGLEAIYRKPRTSDAQPDHHVYPYLLRELTIDRPDQVWCADITYIPVTTGFLYLVAIMDWASRHVLSWRLSNTMDSSFCVEALEAALQTGTPGIFNTDQGSQFTSAAFTDRVQAAGARCSMDGRGRCLDNVFIERLWRSLKYEAVYLHELSDGFAAEQVISEWMTFYSDVRPHSALGGCTPAEAYREERAA